MHHNFKPIPRAGLTPGAQNKKIMWVLTYDVHDYDQYGEYFLCVFLNKPSAFALQEALQIYEEDTERIARTLLNSGQSEESDSTYYLREVEPADTPG